MKLKLFSILALGIFMAACDTEIPQVAEVVCEQKEPCNVPGSVADFKQGKKDQVFFDFDKSKIVCEGEKVPAMKEFLCKYGKNGSIVGHCDTRGSSEYNLALGQRRAGALAASLKKHGLPAGSICGAYSVGKERPLVAGTTEDCHAQNRTAIFVLNDASGAEASAASPVAGPEVMEPAKAEENTDTEDNN